MTFQPITPIENTALNEPSTHDILRHKLEDYVGPQSWDFFRAIGSNGSFLYKVKFYEITCYFVKQQTF